ncbi:MAG: outer membrane protein assembly factor BamD [Planctomycetota bacterium]|jgi:outer membrane protein assembly factor BamD (BamD/ComL family)
MCSNLFVVRLTAIVIVLSGIALVDFASGDTWHLDKGGDWQLVADDAAGKYMLSIANVKKLIDAGQVKAAQESLEQLKTDFPNIAGLDMDAFMEAEMLYAEGKWGKALKKYEEFILAWPDSPLYESALEREYSIAFAYLSGQKRKALKVLKLSAYEDGVKIMRRIADRAGDAPIAKRALVAVAKSCEKRGRFFLADPDQTDAYETWADISFRWPTGDIGRDALLGMAHSLHSAYRSHKYDSASLESARKYYEDFKLRYPQLAGEHEIEAKIKMVDQQLAYKQLAVGDYYERAGNKQAANLYYQLVVDSWPGTTAAQAAAAKLHVEGSPPSEAEKRTLGQNLFDAGNTFLDNWFGVWKPTPPTGEKEND